MASDPRPILKETLRTVLAAYRLPGFPRVAGRLPGTQLTFRVRAGESTFVLHRCNEYTEPPDLRSQCLLASFLRRAGLSVVEPLKTKEEESFVLAGERLWMVFPHATGRRGKPNRPEDRAALAEAQGQWVAAAERVRTAPEWELIARTAKRYRQRKSWAWAVPLDRVPHFAAERKVLEKARLELRPEEKETVPPALDGLGSALAQLEQLLARAGVAKLPHTVTHGDFVLTNTLLDGRSATVLDLDCYSYEPRAADFARSVSHCMRRVPEAELRALARAFQSRARLAPEEMECVPLLIAAYELYYAVMHVLLMLEEEGPDRAKMLAAIQEEAEAITRYHKERDRLTRLMLPARPWHEEAP